MAAATADQQQHAQQVVSESSVFGVVAWNAATGTAIVAIREYGNDLGVD
jgi:hypothetical protein